MAYQECNTILKYYFLHFFLKNYYTIMFYQNGQTKIGNATHIHTFQYNLLKHEEQTNRSAIINFYKTLTKKCGN